MSAGTLELSLVPFSGMQRADIAIIVDVDLGADALVLRYRLAGSTAGIVLPEPATPTRVDGLWEHSCFELFLQPAGVDWYAEFNFATSQQWAAYRFTRYREKACDLWLVDAPLVEPASDGLRASIARADLPSGGWRLGLSAVIEEAEGRLSYWALAHPADKPDFHHPDCFVLELPAASAP
ncbi:MAG: DOMON-like domain-containing protein [Sphingomonas sp.]